MTVAAKHSQWLYNYFVGSNCFWNCSKKIDLEDQSRHPIQLALELGWPEMFACHKCIRLLHNYAKTLIQLAIICNQCSDSGSKTQWLYDYFEGSNCFWNCLKKIYLEDQSRHPIQLALELCWPEVLACHKYIRLLHNYAKTLIKLAIRCNQCSDSGSKTLWLYDYFEGSNCFGNCSKKIDLED